MIVEPILTAPGFDAKSHNEFHTAQAFHRNFPKYLPVLVYRTKHLSVADSNISHYFIRYNHGSLVFIYKEITFTKLLFVHDHFKSSIQWHAYKVVALVWYKFMALMRGPCD